MVVQQSHGSDKRESGRLGVSQLNGEAVQRSRYSSFQENGVVAVELDMQLLGDCIVFIRNS